jgi:hypothetical protein
MYGWMDVQYVCMALLGDVMLLWTDWYGWYGSSSRSRPRRPVPRWAPSCGGPARPVIFFFCLRAPTSVHRLPLFTIIPHTNTTVCTVHADTVHATIYCYYHFDCYFCCDFIYHRLPPPASFPKQPGTHPLALFGFRAQQGTRHGLSPSFQGHQRGKQDRDRQERSKPLSNSGTC